MASRSRSSRKSRSKRKLQGIARFFLKPVVWISSLVLLLLIVGGLIFLKKGKPIVHAWRASKAEVAAMKSMDAIEKEDMATASELMRDALQWEVKSTRELPVVRRASGRYMLKIGRPHDSYNAWKRLEEQGALLQEDGVFYLESALKCGLLTEAQRILGGLEVAKVEHKRLPSLRASFFLLKKDQTAALPELREAVRVDPQDLGSAFELARLLTKSPLNGERIEGWEILRQLASSDNTAFQQASLELLQRANQLRPEEAKAILQKSKGGAGMAYADAFILAYNSLEERLRPAFLEEEIPEASKEGLDDRIQIARFLRGLARQDLVLKIIPEEDLERHPFAKPYRIEAIGITESWEKALAALESKADPGDPMMDVLRAHIAKESGRDKEIIMEHLNTAAINAEKRKAYGMILIIADFCETMGDKETAFTVLREGLKNASYAETCLDRLLFMHRKDPLAISLQRILSLLPPQADSANAQVPPERWIYLCLLENQNVKEAAEFALTLQREQPQNNLRLLLVAMSLQKAGDSTKAIDILKIIDPAMLDNGQKSVLASLLLASNDDELRKKGREFLSTIDSSNIIPAESPQIKVNN